MNKIKYLIMMLMFCVLSAMSPKTAFGGVSADEQNSDVSMTITKFQLNDQTLELTYKIKNDSDHDIWMCDSVNIKSNRLDYEAYVAKDAQTLVIRKRFDLPGGNVVLESDFTGRYIRLRPGQERVESLLVTLPPTTNQYFDAEIGKANYTKRVALEIGFYDEDLRALILNIVEVADKLGCDTSTLTHEYHEIYTRFFPGLLLALEFNHRLSSQFRDSINSEGDEILMPPLSWVGIHLGEKVLRLTIDNVYIRCLGEPPLSETEPAEVTMALTGFDVDDTNLELSWRIKNNTDHDVWICDSKDNHPAFSDFEVFMAKDKETLVIRKRFDLPAAIHLELPLPIGRYRCLRAGEELIQSLLLRMPASPNRSFEAETGMTEYAKRLVLEIGFYDEDLRGLILQIVDVANKLNCAAPMIPPLDINNIEVRNRYFAGLLIACTFDSDNWPYFKESVESGDNEMLMPHMGQIFKAEQVLRMTIDGVSIPYSKWAPLTDHK